MAEEFKLPDQETFTREELSQEWKCPQSRIDAYIRSGQLREALPPTAMRDLRRWIFYKCEDNEPLLYPIDIDADDSCEWLLDLIEDGEPLGKYIGKIAQEKVVHCPKHLYVPVDDNAIIKKPKDHHALKVSKSPPDLVRYFYDLYGKALIPLEDVDDGHRICFAPIEKHHFASLLIRIEEVRRFKNRARQTERKSKKIPSIAVERDTQRTEKEQKGLGALSLKTTADDKQPPIPERMLRFPEVCRRAGLSRSRIYTLMDNDQFPKSVKLTGGRSVAWPESVINAWIEEKKEGNE